MKFTAIHLFLLLSLSICGQAQVTTDDLELVIGSWEGEITYLDYQTNKPFTMPANLIVEQGRKASILVLNNLYPDEPKANDSEKIKITKNGALLNGHLVTKRAELENGQIQIQTEHKGKDNRKKALIRYTYLLSLDHFKIRKEVQVNGRSDWVTRNEFTYKRER